jgi:hypothetical protein
MTRAYWAVTAMSEHVLKITWSGVSPSGQQRGARGSYTLAEVRRITGTYFRGGWQELAVLAGDGPLGAENQAEIARIRTDPVTGERSSWVAGGEQP